MYKTRLRAWGFLKYKPRESAKSATDPEFPHKGQSLLALRGVAKHKSQSRFRCIASVGNHSPAEHQIHLRHLQPPESLKFQEVVVGQFASLLLKHLATADNKTELYWKSEVSETIFFIWEGAGLMNRGYNQGHKVMRQGFHNLLSLFDQHTFYAITHLFFFAAPWCNKTINQLLWKYLASHSTQNLHKTHELQHLLERLVRFFNTASYSDDIMTSIRVAILEQFYNLNGGRDSTLVEIVCRAPLKVQRGLLWRDIISNSSREKAVFIQSQHGSTDSRYLDQLYKCLFQECELYGLYHERASQLASKILHEVEGLIDKDKRLYFECTFILACSEWHQWENLRDLHDPRCDRAIARMTEYLAYIESGESEVRMSCFISSFDMLERFQRAVGQDTEADATKQRCLRVLWGIEKTPEPLE
jgi:hypothetical protein